MLPIDTLLRLDAVSCLAMGAVLIAGDRFLATLTGLSARLLLIAGAALVPIGLVMAATARWRPYESRLVRLIVLGNVGWAVGSVAVVMLATTINVVGIALVLAQAVMVAVFAYLEWHATPERNGIPNRLSTHGEQIR